MILAEVFCMPFGRLTQAVVSDLMERLFKSREKHQTNPGPFERTEAYIASCIRILWRLSEQCDERNESLGTL
jgi:hypothetical protein